MATARHVGTTDTPRGLGVGDHACWCYDDPADYVRNVLDYLAEGAAGGDRLWYVGDKSEDELRHDLAPLPRRDEMLDSGQLRVTTAHEAFGDLDAFDLSSPLRDYDGLVDASLEAGFRGLRLSVDVTPLAAGGHASRLPGYELTVDRLVAERPMTILCGYDERRVPALDAIRSVHPVQHDQHNDVGFSLHWDAGGEPRLRLTGEVDLCALDDLRAALRAAAAVSSGPFVLDLSDLQFIDAAATRVLTGLVLEMQVAGRPVSLQSPRRCARVCLEAFDLTYVVAG